MNKLEPPPWTDEDIPLEGEHIPYADEHDHAPVERLTHCVGCSIPLSDVGHPKVCEQCLDWHEKVKRFQSFKDAV